VFLPENSTHMLQPLDVSVFGPMKKKWRQVLADWKADCSRKGLNYATIPKQCFPGLLNELMEKDYSASVRSGFETTGLYPFSMEKALSKLPKEATDVDSDVQRLLLQRLTDMRYNPPATTQAVRPRKKDKLPAGTAYSCVNDRTVVDASEDSSDEDSPDEDSTDKDEDQESDSSNYEEEEERSSKLGKKRPREQELIGPGGDLKEIEQPHVQRVLPAQGELPAQEELPALNYKPDSYIVVVYEGDWYVGQVMSKDGEPEAEEGDQYLLVTFMERFNENSLKWPRRMDILNVLQADVLFECQPPSPGMASSSSRSLTFKLTDGDLEKAKQLFDLFKAYYPTKIPISFFQCSGSKIIHPGSGSTMIIHGSGSQIIHFGSGSLRPNNYGFERIRISGSERIRITGSERIGITASLNHVRIRIFLGIGSGSGSGIRIRIHIRTLTRIHEAVNTKFGGIKLYSKGKKTKK